MEANKVFGYSWGEKAPKTPVSLDAAHLLETDFVIFQFPPFFTLGVRDLNFGRCLEILSRENENENERQMG